MKSCSIRAKAVICAKKPSEYYSRYGLLPSILDIDTDPGLRERFDTCVPVIEIDGKIRFRGRVDEVLLRRIVGW